MFLIPMFVAPGLLEYNACGKCTRIAFAAASRAGQGEQMRNAVINILAVVTAAIGWWSLVELTGQIRWDEPGAMPSFYALLFLAVTATLIPPAAFLNRRFAPDAVARDPYRFIRHSAWGGLSVAAWGWLLEQDAFNLGFALLTVLIFIAVEFLIARLRSDPQQGTPET
jgi:protein-S-isoprenylcysteine O-methyltransferase Ste14